MKNAVVLALKTLFKPISSLCCNVYELINSLLEIIVGIPSKIVGVFTLRFSKKANNLSDTLDKKNDDARKQQMNKETHNTIQSLFYADGVIGNSTVARRLKWFTVILLQLVSFVTTFKGFYQTFSSIHWSLAFALAIVVQVIVVYASGTVASNYAPKTRKALLSVALAVSIFFSYVGISETFIPYQDYAREKYVSYADAYEGMQFAFDGITECGENPIGKIEGLYKRVDALVTTSENLYGEEALSGAEQKLERLRNKTKWVSKENPESIYMNPDGSVSTYGGGSEYVEVPAEEDAELVQAEEDRLNSIKDIMNNTEIIRNMLNQDCEMHEVINVVNEQMREPSKTTDEFVGCSESVKLLCEQANALSQKIGSAESFSVDLQELMYDYRRSSAVNELYEMKSFSEILSMWNSGEDVSYIEDEELSELSFLTVNNTTELKKLVDNEMFEAHHSVGNAINLISQNTSTADEVYLEHQLKHPMIYAVSLLNPTGGSFGAAIMCLFVALFNDLFGLLIGLLLEHKKVNWYNISRLNTATIAPHIYSQFKSVMMPIIVNKAGPNADAHAFYGAFVCVMNDYMSRFKLNAMLCGKGYSRYYLGELNNDDFNNFCSFLIICELAKPITHDECVQYGLVGSVDELKENDQGVLLTSKGEFWLNDILGSASDDRFGYSDDGQPVFT